MTTQSGYAIGGGVPGRERLRVLARTLHDSTGALFERLGVGPGHVCLDLGCGGGDVTLALARRVEPGGRVLGVDMDAAKLELARQEAAAQAVGNVAFEALDIRSQGFGGGYDLIYVRFVLSHLAGPSTVIAGCFGALRPGGLLVVEDIHFKGGFVWPETAAFERYCELYTAVVERRGGNPNIGPQLPSMLMQGGFEQVAMNVVQPAAAEGEAKLINPITLEQIAGAALQDGLASQQELDTLIGSLYAFAADPHTVAGLARVIQAWGRRPAA